MEELRCDSQAGGLPAGRRESGRLLATNTRPRHEERVNQYWLERGIETFLPCHRVRRRWSDRRKELWQPLFPSYVLVRIDAVQRGRAVQAPGFLWFVRGVGGAIAVDDSELEAICRALGSGLEYDSFPGAQLGDEV